MITKPSGELTLKDRLSRLSYEQVCKLLGDRADRLLQVGGALEIDIADQVSLDERSFRLRLPPSRVTIELSDGARRRLLFECSTCEGTCEHIGAAFSLILEDKMALGLSTFRPESAPLGLLSEKEVISRALAERAERAKSERMRVKSKEPEKIWTDYMVTNRSSGRSHRVALRGWDIGESFCSCPDFRKNTLGTCKHIMRAQSVVKKRFPAKARNSPYKRKSFGLHLRYGEELELRLLVPASIESREEKIVGPITDVALSNISDLLTRIRKLEVLGHDVTIYPDAEEYIQMKLFQRRIEARVDEIHRDPANHVLRATLLKTKLLPYQLDGIAFAAGVGRAVLADDMGLGKTIQGVGVAELLAREGAVSRVLVICPASIKSQWRAEIQRFSDRTCRLVLGGAEERARQYGEDVFFTVCNYEQVLRDILAIEQERWDLIILDEAQRIKNWEAKTSRVIKGLRSPFSLVLTGTPLENRLDDLYSVVEFVDDRRLGPAFKFFNRHRMVDERGKVLGYRNLGELRKSISPVLLRRTRASVMKDLPPRTTEIVRITPTDEQLELHGTHMRIIGQIVKKKFLTEMDMLRLRKALLMCRMLANSTYLVTKQSPGYSSKLERLEDLLAKLSEEEDRKIVLFSEWTTMLGLIEPLLEKNGMRYVRLDGSVPQKKRAVLMHDFQTNPDCRVFITTNAGATGLNLQAANTVINVELPWNPAVLEQRISRVHRMGQVSPVQVFLLVTEETLEENLLTTLSAKHELSLAALDLESGVDTVEMMSGVEELKRRLELLLGAKPEPPPDESQRAREEAETRRIEQKERISLAGGQLLSAAFTFLGEVLPKAEESESTRAASQQLKQSLSECLEQDDQGRHKLTVTLPDLAALDILADTLARIAPAMSATTQAQ